MTKFQKYATIFVVAALAIIAFFLTYKVADHLGYKRGYNAYHPADTVVVIDTHIVDHPVEVVKWYEKEKPVYIPVHDTTTTVINDTTFIVMPREVKQYKDSTYMAQVSGVDPSLDLIEVYQKTVTVTQTVVEKEPYTERMYFFADGSFSPLYRGIRVGAMYEHKIFGPFNGRIGVGHEYSNLGRDWFVEAGVSLNFFQK